MITERSQMKICGLSFVCLSPIGSHRDHFEVLHLSFISNRVAPGPRRGHTMVTAGLDPRVIEISCIYDPKGVAHHHASGGLAYWLLCVPFGDEVLGLSLSTAGQDLRLCTCDLFEVLRPLVCLFISNRGAQRPLRGPASLVLFPIGSHRDLEEVTRW